MNVYDFDKTIYKDDSTVDFYFFSLRRHPSIVLLFPSLIRAVLLWAFGMYTKTQFKECFYRFLTKIPDIDKELDVFWNTHKNKIKKFYLREQKQDDVIISASPEFLLKPICRRLGIKYLYASKVDKKSGKYDGMNCWGKEKVNRFYAAFGSGAVIDNFYSDSLSDTPLAEIAKKSYIVIGEGLTDWSEYQKKSENKVRFLSLEFFMFILIGCVNTINGIVFSWLYSLLFNANFAFVCGYITSLAIAYTLNSKIIFKQKLCFEKFIKFCISYIPNFIIQNLTVLLLYNILGWYKLIAFAAAAVIGIPVTFVFVKIFAFGKKTKTMPSED